MVNDHVPYNAAGTDHELILIDEIGQGTFGTVYRAQCGDTVVAAKIVQAEKESPGYKMIIKKCDVIRYIVEFVVRY